MSESESVSGATSIDLSGSASHIVQARDVAGGVHFHASPAAASGPLPQQLPGDVRGFVNRVAELNRLSEALISDRPQADVLRSASRLADARETLLRSLRLAADSDNPTSTALGLNELARLELAESRAQDALATSHSAAIAFKRLNYPSREAIAWGVSGQALHALGRYEEAEAFHRRAAAIHRDLDEYWPLAQDLDNLASTLDLLGKHQQAQQSWSEAVTALRRLSDPVATTLRHQIKARLTGRQGTI